MKNTITITFRISGKISHLIGQTKSEEMWIFFEGLKPDCKFRANTKQINNSW
jgi:hypothetical protein